MNMGWIDEEGNDNNATIMEDLASLDQGITALVSKDTVGECVSMTLKMLSEDPMMDECEDSYTEEEGEMLMEVMMKMVNYKCFNHVFDEACKSHVQGEIDNFLMETYTGSG